MIYLYVGWLKCPCSTLLMAAKWIKEEKSTYKIRDVAHPHNDIMNIVADLLKGFFILTMTALRRGPSKRCKMNYLDASTHVSTRLPSFLLSRSFRQSNLTTASRNSCALTFIHSCWAHLKAINMCVGVTICHRTPYSCDLYASSSGIVFHFHYLLYVLICKWISVVWRVKNSFILMSYFYMNLSHRFVFKEYQKCLSWAQHCLVQWFSKISCHPLFWTERNLQFF